MQVSREGAPKVPDEVAVAVCTTLREAVAYLEQFHGASRHRPPRDRGDPTRKDWYQCPAEALHHQYTQLRQLGRTLKGYADEARITHCAAVVAVRRVTSVLSYVTATLSPWNISSSVQYVHAGRAMSSLNQMRNVLRELGALDACDGSASEA